MKGKIGNRMDLLEASKILNKIKRFENVINTTIGIINCKSDIIFENKISMNIKKVEDNEVSSLLIDRMFNALLSCDAPFIAKTYNNGINISYYLDKDGVAVNDMVIDELIKILYLAVDEAKVWFCPEIEQIEAFANEMDVPLDIYEQIDNWNEGCMWSEREDEYVDIEDLKVYRMNKNCLYSISLGYYDIDMNVVESDLVPELIGVLFESTEDFCYVISDKDYIYFYSAVQFNDDIEFDIMEGLINHSHLLSITEQEETLEDLFSEVEN